MSQPKWNARAAVLFCVTSGPNRRLTQDQYFEAIEKAVGKRPGELISDDREHFNILSKRPKDRA